MGGLTAPPAEPAVSESNATSDQRTSLVSGGTADRTVQACPRPKSATAQRVSSASVRWVGPARRPTRGRANCRHRDPRAAFWPA